MKWRRIAEDDLAAVVRIADRVHVAHPEDPAVFRERLSLFPGGCHVCEVEGMVRGYLVSHPWRRGEPPKLDSFLSELPRYPDTYYIHDIALLPEARGLGAAGSILDRIALLAKDHSIGNLSLVAVNKTTSFWMRHGFQIDGPDGPSGSIASYGADARLMIRHLA